MRTDKAAYLEHFADPEIAHNLLAIPFPYTEADADWWLDRCEQSIGSPMTKWQVLFADLEGVLVALLTGFSLAGTNRWWSAMVTGALYGLAFSLVI